MNIRQKGQNGEREAAEILGKMLGRDDLVRNLEQTRSGGGDITGIDGITVEVKRQEALAINTWWRQVCVAADRDGTVPVLMYRKNRSPWHFCIPAYFLVIGAKGRLTIDSATFSLWLKQWNGAN